MSEPVTVALAGDTMLGRGVAERLSEEPASALFGAALLDVLETTDAVVLNLECCISERGQPWPGRVFHFRAPPAALDALDLLGVRCVTLGNNHALDFGETALLDTIGFLSSAGIVIAGAGADEAAARCPATFRAGEQTVTVLGCTDHPAEYAAGPHRPGVAYADLQHGVPAWITDTVHGLAAAPGPVLVMPHWGPNMTTAPAGYIRRAAQVLVDQGATLVAGHSAHVFHGAAGRVVYDLGDFVDDYLRDVVLRNDLGVLWLATVAGPELRALEAVPLHLGYCHTTLARGDDELVVRQRLRAACAAFGTTLSDTGRGLAVELAQPAGRGTG